VCIAPDLLYAFPDSESVNETLRGLKKIVVHSIRPAAQSRKAASAAQ
jgi:hypothetical protein